jgi:hypothetical protein
MRSTERPLTVLSRGAAYVPGVESTWYDTLLRSAFENAPPSPGSGD